MIDTNIIGTLIVFFINAIGITLVLIVLFSKTKPIIAKLFSLMTLAIFIWVDFAFLARNVDNEAFSLWMIKIAWSATPILSFLIYIFLRNFLTEGKYSYKKSDYIYTIIIITLSVITLVTDLIIYNIEFVNDVLKIIYGNLVFIYLLVVLYFVIIDLGILYKSYSDKSIDKEKKKNIKILAIGFTFFFIFNTLFNLVLPIFFQVAHLYEFGDYSTIVLLSCIAYAIVRHKLFGIRIILGVFLVSILGNFLIIDIFFFSESLTKKGVRVFIFLAFLAVAYTLIKTMLNDINQSDILSKRNRELDTIFRITNQVITTLDPEEVAQRAVDLIPTEMGYYGGIISIYNNEKKTLKPIAITITENERIRKIIYKRNLNEIVLDIEDENAQNLISIQAIKQEKPIISRNLFDALYMKIPKSEEDSLAELLKVKSVVAYPIKARNKIIGVVVFALQDKTPEEFTNEDHDLMRMFSYQLGIGLENADLYTTSKHLTKSLEEQNFKLEAKNRELDTIFKISNQILTTLDPNEVAQRGVDSVPTEMGYLGAMIAKIDKKKDTFKLLAFTQKLFDKKLIDNVPDNEFIRDLEINKVYKSDVLKYDEDNFGIATSVKESVSPVIPEILADKIQEVHGVKTVVTVPLRSRNKVIGIVLFFVNHKNSDELKEEDFDLMQTFTNQISIGLENAHLFNQYQELSVSLVQKNKQLEDYSKKERDILDIMGHELRTPITIVRNSLSFLSKLLEADDYDQEKVNHYLEVALRSAGREINIIETMLAATKVEADKIRIFKEDVDTKDVLDEAVVGQKENALEKGMDIIMDVPSDIPNIYADRSRVQEVFDNFLSNAVKYTNEGKVTITAEDIGEYIKFSFKDTGIGIPEEDVASLGTKFFRVSQHVTEEEEKADDTSRLYNVVRPGGTGLGLYVTYNLVRLHGGNVALESKLGEGSTFTFTIPKYTGQKIEHNPTRSKDLIQEYKDRKAQKE